MRHASAIVLAALLAGCLAPAFPASSGGEWRADACDVSGADRFSGNAPVVASLRGDDLALARRVAEAFGDAWTSDEPKDPSDGARQWTTRDGEVRVSRRQLEDDLGALRIDYTTSRGDAFDRRSVAAGLARLGADARTLAVEDGSRGSGRFHQTFAGMPILGTTGSWNAGDGDPAPYGRWAGISMSPPRDLSETKLLLPPAEAARLALAYDRCDLDREGRTEATGYARQGEPSDAGLAVLHDSLVRVVAIPYTEPERSHCGLIRQVALDAETGAAHGHVVFGCD